MSRRTLLAGLALAIAYASTLVDPIIVGRGTVQLPDPALKLLAIGVSVLAASMVAATWTRHLRHPGMLALLALPAVMALSALWAPSASDTVLHAIWYAAVGLTVTGAVLELQFDRANRLLLSIAAGSIVLGMALTPLNGVDTRTPLLPSRAAWPRLGGLEGWYAAFAMTATLVAIGSTAHALRHRRPVGAVGAAIGILGVVASQSRQGLIALAIGLVVIVFASSRWRRQVLALAIAGTSTLLAAIVVGVDQIGVAVGATSGLSGRTTVWDGALGRFALRPWFGWGWNGLLEWSEAQAESGFNLWNWIHAHNLVLEVLADFGLIGLCPVLAIAAVLHRYSDRLDPTAVAYLAALAVHSLTEGILWDAPATRWTIVALALSSLIAGPHGHASQPTHAYGEPHEGNSARRRHGLAPAPGDGRHFETAATRVRQADDLLPDLHAHARWNPGDSDHHHAG